MQTIPPTQTIPPIQTIPKDAVIYHFDKNTPAVYSVADGETFWVETDDCYNGQIASADVLRPQIDVSIMDCSVGPIAVQGARPGDTLRVDILDIRFAKQGVMVTSPGLGILGDRITEPNTKIIPIREGYAYFSEDIVLPLTPMIGVLGVAPADGAVHCAVPGNHGANLDSKILTIGSSVFLPVAVEDANLALGDLHACMGDGEMSGSGIETAGRVLLRTSVCKNLPFTRPVVETADSIYMLASSADIHAAVKTAANDMVRFLMRKKNLSFPDAYRLLSITCDIQISQLVNEALTVRVRAPKADLKIDSPL